ncbi:MAG: hypothetical protein KKA54_08800 [Proteobacteria bacterium]|nr:hypothetical protein [Pseudomonadota bacterium]MBU0966467.1 hypothetical protein [Pseudomonadota bacterium]
MISRKLEEIKLLMEYAVPAADRQQALALLEEFSNDRIALNLFHAFYSYLPEGLDDAINGLQVIALKQGIFLLCAATGIDKYLYLVNQEQAEFLGSASNGIWDSEVLEYFGYPTREESLRSLEDLTRFPAYNAANADTNLCPICAAANGEFHTLGCPVEVCPWCGGQLTHCTCRFTITGKNRLAGEDDLESFHELLNSKGRIPFEASQRPAYPAAGEEE